MKQIPMLEKFAAESLVEQDGELIFSKEKFAELIIQNCISQISLIGISNFENDDITWTVEKSIANIKEHFGVK